MQYELITKSHPRRAQVEQFICERYWLSFKACLSQLPDTLIAVSDHNQLVAACGLQFAEQRTLFSECYLNKPLTSHDIAGLPMPKRDEIAEVGSMAAISAVYLPTLFAAIVHALEVHQRSAVVFTATRYLQLKLERSGIALSYLADATQSALPIELHDLWGDYYQHQPRVLAGWTHQGQTHIKAMAC